MGVVRKVGELNYIDNLHVSVSWLAIGLSMKTLTFQSKTQNIGFRDKGQRFYKFWGAVAFGQDPASVNHKLVKSLLGQVVSFCAGASFLLSEIGRQKPHWGHEMKCLQSPLCAMPGITYVFNVGYYNCYYNAIIIIMKLSYLTERETQDSPSFCEAIILLSSDR